MAVADGAFSCVESAGPNSIWNTCIYTEILRIFENTLNAGLTQGLIGASLNLLHILGALEVAVALAWMAMQDTDEYITDVFCVLVRIGLYAQLIANCLPWGLEFANGAIEAGLLFSAPTAAFLQLPPLTLAHLHDPGALMYYGFRLFTPLITYIENLGVSLVWHTLTATIYGIVAVGGVAMVIWIGVNIMVGWVELLLVLAFGTPMHAFAIFEYTRFLSLGILQTQAAAALRLGVHAAIAGLIFPLLASLQATDSSDPGWDTVFALLGITFLSGYLSSRAYRLAWLITGGQWGYGGFTGSGIVSMVRQNVQVGMHVVQAVRQISSMAVSAGTQISTAARTPRSP